MSLTRIATVLVVLAVIATGISLANKPNMGDEYNITVSPSTLVLSRYSADVTVHSNIPCDIVEDGSVRLYRITEMDGDVVYSEEIVPISMFADNLGHLVGKFDTADVEEKVEPGEIEFVLTWDVDEDSFTSNPDTIMVKE